MKLMEIVNCGITLARRRIFQCGALFQRIPSVFAAATNLRPKDLIGSVGKWDRPSPHSWEFAASGYWIRGSSVTSEMSPLCSSRLSAYFKTCVMPHNGLQTLPEKGMVVNRGSGVHGLSVPNHRLQFIRDWTFNVGCSLFIHPPFSSDRNLFQP